MWSPEPTLKNGAYRKALRLGTIKRKHYGRAKTCSTKNNDDPDMCIRGFAWYPSFDDGALKLVADAYHTWWLWNLDNY